MAEKKPEPAADLLQNRKKLREALKLAAVEGMKPVAREPLRDPVSGERDFEATKGYGQKTAFDLPGLMFDPAKQLDYATQMGRAWMALWTGWLSQGRGQGGVVADPRPFDIFLSHSKRDEVPIGDVRRTFEEAGYRVYVDWADDPLLDRTHVDRATAERLQERMRQCKALVMALSNQSAGSAWVQWELGFFDALRGRIFILPLDKEAQRAVERQEYYQLYKVLDPADYRADFVRQYNAAVG